MPVTVLVGDLFDSEAQTLVNTVNCVGVMGRGVALGFKKRFPAMYKDYVKRCGVGEVTLGRPYLFTTILPPWVLNFPTKDHWRSVARLDDIVAGLDYLEANYREWGITSLAVPPLGCGEGQLEWRIVGRELHRRLDRLQIPVALYAPFGTPSAELEAEFLTSVTPRVTHGQSPEGTRKVPAAWFGIAEVVAHLDEASGGRGVGRIVLQKAAYFASVGGIPTGLTFSADSYGPFAANLRQVTTKLVNNGVLAESRSGRSIIVRPGIAFGDAERVFSERSVPWAGAIRRVADLLRGASTRQAEVLATVHYAWKTIEQTEHPDRAIVLAYASQWKQRRVPPLSANELDWALDALTTGGWIRPVPRARSHQP
jgi:O-acetyl-ADP-ribose deacetylase (regulator of RNase III)